jgi:TonB family protein
MTVEVAPEDVGDKERAGEGSSDMDQSEILRFEDPSTSEVCTEIVEPPAENGGHASEHSTFDAERKQLAVEIVSEGEVSEAGYWDDVRDAIARKLRYPDRLGAKRTEGSVLLRIVLDGSGRLLDVEVVSSKANAAFEYAALQAVRRAAPFGPAKSETAEVREADIPIRFAREP